MDVDWHTIERIATALIVIIGAYVNWKKTEAVHIIVNSQRDLLLAKIANLEAKLELLQKDASSFDGHH
jgi:hypothetical protein